MAHRRDWKFGYEGRYRRTMSPSPPTHRPEVDSPPPPPPPPAGIGRSVSYAAPRTEEGNATSPRLKTATSTGRLTEGGSKVARQPSTTVVFTDAELRAFRAREQGARERARELLSTSATADSEDKENMRETNGAVVEAVSHPRRQYSCELLPPRPASPEQDPAASPVSPPSPAAPAAYRSPMADAKSERFAAYRKYSELKPSCKPAVVSPTAASVATDSQSGAGSPQPAAVVRTDSGRVPAEVPPPPPAAASPPAPPAVTQLVTPTVTQLVTPAAPQAATPPPMGRAKLAEELECERLSRAFVSRAAVDNRLQNLLVPGPGHRTSAHYIQGLFDLPLTQVGSRKPGQATLGTALAPVTSPVGSPDKPPSETSPLRPDSAYFTTSASKAKFLTQYGRDVSADQSLKNVKDVEEVKRQQEELAARISRKLEILREEQQAIRQEIETNAALGAAVAARVQQTAAPAEADKYATYVEQVGTITSLLLGLSGRLARAENAFSSLGEGDADERANLTSKRDKLCEQLEEARKLKLNIDRRSEQVNVLLRSYLSEDELADYQHFIQMKAKLIMDAREIDDKLRLGEEQLSALTQHA